MKNQLVRIAVLALFVTTFAVASAHAQNAGNNLRVTIPFDFVIGGKTLAAGNYSVSAVDSRTMMKIQRLEQSGAAYFIVNSVMGRDIQGESKLVFHKYGEQYFLSQIWTAGRTVGGELSKTSRERILQREIAGRAAKPQSVAVSARPN